jgi:hypothetical protein
MARAALLIAVSGVVVIGCWPFAVVHRATPLASGSFTGAVRGRPLIVIDESGWLVAVADASDHRFPGDVASDLVVQGPEPPQLFVRVDFCALATLIDVHIAAEVSSIRANVSYPWPSGEPAPACPGVLGAVLLTFDRAVEPPAESPAPSTMPSASEVPSPSAGPSPTAVSSPSVSPSPSSEATQPPAVGTRIQLPGDSARVRIISMGAAGLNDTARMLVWDPTRTFVAGFGRGDRSRYPSVLTDHGWYAKPFVIGDPADPQAVYVSWIGGMCDDWTRLEISPNGRHWTLFEGTPIGCELIGVGWYAHLRFSRAIDASAIDVHRVMWPRTGPLLEDNLELARVMTRSIVSPTVVALESGPLSELLWQPVAQQFPSVDPSELPQLEQIPVIHVVLGASYRSCSNGHCYVMPGSEDFLFGAEDGDLVAYREVLEL